LGQPKQEWSVSNKQERIFAEGDGIHYICWNSLFSFPERTDSQSLILVTKSSFMMKNILTTLVLSLFLVAGFGQARLVMNGTIGIAMNGGTSGSPVYLVIDNPAPNGLTSAPSGAIRSESEFNIVKWNTKASTGLYTIPFISLNSGSAVFVAVNAQISTPGDAAGFLKFSTYHHNNLLSGAPSDVTQLNHFITGAPNQQNVVDRFWIVDPGGVNPYVTKPAVSLSFLFDPSEMDAVLAPNILIQRFNPTNNSWLDANYLGHPVNTPFPNSAGPVNVTAADFFRSWTLSSSANPLPIELVRFTAACQGTDRVELTWITASEVNNDYFTVERSEDGIVWEAFEVLLGAGNSSSQLTYKATDYNPFSGITYYRLTQTDFDGNFESFDPIVSDCDGVGFEIISANSIEASTVLDIIVSAGHDERFDIELYDMSGKQVMRQNQVVLVSGMNYLRLEKGDLGKGIYILSLNSLTEQMTRKVLLD